MEIVIVVFERVTALDAVGPYEVLSRLPGAHVRFVAKREGPVRTDVGSFVMMADGALSPDLPADVLVVSGGVGVSALERDPEVLECIRRLHERTRYTTSVCTGSLVLGAAGILRGLPATTHWTRAAALEAYGARYVPARYVEAGNIVTAAGVSAGIDMALALAARVAGPEVAQAIQLGIEYDPMPPFDAGSPSKAAPGIKELVLDRVRQRLEA